MSNDITNINFLSPFSFELIIKNKPNVTYFCQRANIPGLSLGFAPQPTFFASPIPRPGDLVYNDLTISFKVDESLNSYREIWNWMVALGFPVDFSQYKNILQQDSPLRPGVGETVSDLTLMVLDNNHRPRFEITFEDAFPITLSDLTFDATETDVNFLTAEVSFKYKLYQIHPINGQV